MANQQPLSVINALTQFANSTQADWNNVNIPIPAGLVVYAPDTTAVKIGDGKTLYVNLPVLFKLSDVVNFMSLLNTKADKVHSHVISDITDLKLPQRLICETVVDDDGITVTLPWAVDNVDALDVFIDGKTLMNSQVSISGKALVLPGVYATGTSVRVVWNILVSNTNAASSEPSSVTVLTGNTGNTGSGLSGFVIFDSESGNIWLPSGSGVPFGDTVFTSETADIWLTSGSGIPDGDTLFLSVNPSQWTDSLPAGNGDIIFYSIAATNWNATGSGVPDGDTVFNELDYSSFTDNGNGLADASTLIVGYPAGNWA